jgi:hypothetical protein
MVAWVAAVIRNAGSVRRWISVNLLWGRDARGATVRARRVNSPALACG